MAIAVTAANLCPYRQKTDAFVVLQESSLTLKNAFGQAEKLSVAATYARSGSNTERATFQKPRFLGLPLYLSATGANELHVRLSAVVVAFLESWWLPN